MFELLVFVAGYVTDRTVARIANEIGLKRRCTYDSGPHRHVVFHVPGDRIREVSEILDLVPEVSRYEIDEHPIQETAR
jgi:hypothetical protein